MHTHWLHGAAIALLLINGAPVCAAADYPARPIRLIAPFAPGGGVDVSARFIAKQLAESFGQSAIVDNRPGAGSTLGTDIVAKAAPDGHTLLVTHNAIAINQSLYSKLPYDTVRDFTQVAFIGVTTFTLVVNPGLAAKTVKELVALAKAKPGALNYASTGAGGGSHLATEYFMLATVTKALALPEVRQQLMNQGIEPRDMSPAEFAAFVRREVEKCAKIIKASGARAEM